MDTLSASAAARRLGTSVPRVQRAIDRLGLAGQRGRGGRVRLSEAQLKRLTDELGVVPSVDGLSRVETQVLAALARAPRGLTSTRAVARRARVSPTAAARARIARRSRPRPGGGGMDRGRTSAEARARPCGRHRTRVA